MNPAAILALISDLYAQLQGLQQENARLQATNPNREDRKDDGE